MLAGRLEVRVRVLPGLPLLLRLPAAFLAEVLLDRVDEVVAADAHAVLRGLKDVGEDEQMVEPGRVPLLHVAATGSVEPLERSGLVASVDARPRVGELAVGIGGHGWGKTVSLSSQTGHTRVRISSLASRAWTRLKRSCDG